MLTPKLAFDCAVIVRSVVPGKRTSLAMAPEDAVAEVGGRKVDRPSDEYGAGVDAIKSQTEAVRISGPYPQDECGGSQWAQVRKVRPR
ncbi:hypothetical protein HPB52_006776 [Rhipicephalus sanguineus]|uniref:Uncharacterized protein n=1 Tax=Rhipicephalus sanguineus TaxID=34632 RepID=A0A9D4QLH5_RHISA|nr:hypothetical protein HPB52_006776 [Rhipicephalus sanguineus]